MRKKKFLIIVVAMVVLATITTTVAWASVGNDAYPSPEDPCAEATDPVISVSPLSGPVGTSIDVKVSMDRLFIPPFLYWDETEVNQTWDNQGTTMTTTIHVPMDATLGGHTIELYVMDSDYCVSSESVIFTVESAPTPSEPSVGPPVDDGDTPPIDDGGDTQIGETTPSLAVAPPTRTALPHTGWEAIVPLLSGSGMIGAGASLWRKSKK